MWPALLVIRTGWVASRDSSAGGGPAVVPRSRGLERRVGWLEAKALPEPRIGVVRVAEPFPEPGPVVREELDSAQPLCALPEVLVRHHEPERIAVVGCERLAVGVRGEQRVAVLERLERH